MSDEKNMRKSPVQAIDCLRKIQRSLSRNFFFSNSLKDLVRKARSRELRQKLWTYHQLCIAPKETNLYHSSPQKKGYSLEPIINADSFSLITTKKCRYFITLMYQGNI